MNKAKGLGFNENLCEEYEMFLEKSSKETGISKENLEKELIEKQIEKYRESELGFTERELFVAALITVISVYTL